MLKKNRLSSKPKLLWLSAKKARVPEKKAPKFTSLKDVQARISKANSNDAKELGIKKVVLKGYSQKPFKNVLEASRCLTAALLLKGKILGREEEFLKKYKKQLAYSKWSAVRSRKEKLKRINAGLKVINSRLAEIRVEKRKLGHVITKIEGARTASPAKKIENLRSFLWYYVATFLAK